MSTITIIVSAHNRANYLSNSVGSWFSKPTLPDKVIVIDDRSTEDIFGVIDIFCQQHPEWARLFEYYRVRDEGQGWRNPGACHNFGVKNAHTDYYAILDPETMFVNDCIGATKRWLDGHPVSFVNAGIHYETNSRYYDDFNPFDTYYVIHKAKKQLGFPPAHVGTTGWEVCYMNMCWSHAYAAGKCEHYIKIGGKDERMAGWGYEDVDIRNRMQRNGYTHDTTDDIAIIHVGHGNMRIHPWGFPEDRPEAEIGMRQNEQLLHQNDAAGIKIANENKQWGMLPIEREYRWTNQG
jgi:glycosyltransferase involved in cell wall biosynthesis